jgi:hypothetical protein
MERIVFTTFVTDEEWKEKCAVPLMNSSRYFHPEIPFKIFTLEEIHKESADVSIGNCKAVIGKLLSNEYDLVVILDADSIITAQLDEILEADYQIAGVRNRSDHGSVHFADPAIFQIPNICTMDEYMNAGLVASRAIEFFNDWDALKEVKRFDLDQGTLNMVAYSGKYKLKVLDPIGKPYYYGVANTYGDSTAWDSWKSIQLVDSKLWLKNKSNVNKQVKILHKAGSGKSSPPGEKFAKDIFKPEVFDFIQMITGGK